LLGFAELHLTPGWLPAVHYWRGITEALKANGVNVITTTVPPSASIEQRAEELARGIADAAGGRHVNIIAHSMGGLDARYMISHLRPANVAVHSLVTVASPHHGSSFADFLFQEIGNDRLPGLYKLVGRLGMETGAFEQLTTTYMAKNFNPRTPDNPNVRYFSYGASKCYAESLFASIVATTKGGNSPLETSCMSGQLCTLKGTL
jgi:triacylglycerol lipase